MQTEHPILRRLRELDRSQGWLARKLGIHPSNINRWVKGTAPMIPRRRREVALALGIPEHLVEPVQEMVA